MSQLTISIVVFLCTVVMFLSGKVALGLIGMAASVALQLTGVLPATTVWGNFTNTNVVMFGALFVVSAGLMKTSLIDNMVEKLSTVRGNYRTILWSCLGICIVMSTLMNSTTTMATMIPLILIICEKSEVNARKVMKPCCDMANMWTASLPVGMGASGYLTTNLLIQQMGGTVEMGYFDNAILKVPPLIVATLVYMFFGAKLTPNAPLVPADGDKPVAAAGAKAAPKLSPVKEKIAYAIFFGSVAGMIATSLLKWSIPAYMFAVLGGLACVVFGILTTREACSKIPLDLLFLVGGMLNVAAALGSTGGADIIGQFMSKLLGGTTNTYVVLFVLFAVPFACTQFMNNIAVANAFNPLGIATCMACGVDPRLGALAVGLAAATSTMTPMASAPQAMIMGPGQYKFMEYVKCSAIPTLCYIAAFMIYCPLVAKVLWGI